jgi:hypothetical protein
MEEDVRRELREDSPCGLTGVPDSDITVTYTVRPEDSFHLYRGSAMCRDPRCIQADRDAALISAVHARLDAAGQDDPLERVLHDFEGEYFHAARTQEPERLARAAAQGTALIEQARTRFPQLVVQGLDEEPKQA